MEISRTTLTQQRFDKAEVLYPSNSVIVEIENWREDIKTKSGVVIGFNADVLYAEGAGSHIADVARVYGRVVKQPSKIYYHPTRNDSPPWHPRLETQVGDYVWYNTLSATNCEELLVGDRLYKVIPYQDLFVARRGGIQGEIIPLNGFCILQTMTLEAQSKFDVISKLGVDKSRGRVLCVGQPNLAYQNKINADHDDVQEGDVAIFDSRIIPAYLERNEFNMNFSEGERVFVVQRHRISLTLRQW
jgi:hypothetical protein